MDKSDCVSVTFPCCALGQVWYLIVSIPDLCNVLEVNHFIIVHQSHLRSYMNPYASCYIGLPEQLALTLTLNK